MGERRRSSLAYLRPGRHRSLPDLAAVRAATPGPQQASALAWVGNVAVVTVPQTHARRRARCSIAVSWIGGRSNTCRSAHRRSAHRAGHHRRTGTPPGRGPRPHPVRVAAPRQTPALRPAFPVYGPTRGAATAAAASQTHPNSAASKSSASSSTAGPPTALPGWTTQGPARTAPRSTGPARQGLRRARRASPAPGRPAQPAAHATATQTPHQHHQSHNRFNQARRSGT